MSSYSSSLFAPLSISVIYSFSNICFVAVIKVIVLNYFLFLQNTVSQNLFHSFPYLIFALYIILYWFVIILYKIDLIKPNTCLENLDSSTSSASTSVILFSFDEYCLLIISKNGPSPEKFHLHKSLFRPLAETSPHLGKYKHLLFHLHYQ